MYDINVLIRDNEFKTFLLCENEGKGLISFNPFPVSPTPTHSELFHGPVGLSNIHRHIISISIQLAEYGVSGQSVIEKNDKI